MAEGTIKKPFSVINNLTSTSTTDALSAAQGKQLKTDLTLKAKYKSYTSSPSGNGYAMGGYWGEINYNNDKPSNTICVIPLGMQQNGQAIVEGICNLNSDANRIYYNCNSSSTVRIFVLFLYY